jgi:hypothetical protein
MEFTFGILMTGAGLAFGLALREAFREAFREAPLPAGLL